MPFADVNGQRIRFDDTGGDGPPVIFSHGFLMDREMFAPQAAALAPEFRVIAWDERGFGETEFDGEPFSSARDCLGLLDHLEIDQAVLGGMSQGGFLSLRAALLSPERVRALVLIDTQSGVEDPERLPVYRQMQATWLQVGPVDDLAQAIAGLIIGNPELNEIWIAKWRKLPRENMRAPRGAPRVHRPGARRWRPARLQPHTSRPGQRTAAGVPAVALTPSTPHGANHYRRAGATSSNSTVSHGALASASRISSGLCARPVRR
jgi:pimeloyl-ACP methyl ester carboxylesterase